MSTMAVKDQFFNPTKPPFLSENVTARHLEETPFPFLADFFTFFYFCVEAPNAPQVTYGWMKTQMGLGFELTMLSLNYFYKRNDTIKD